MENVKPYDIITINPSNVIDTMNVCKLDLLIYPEIGMCPFVYLYAHMRLAPIQLTTWGHSDTSGIPTIDYYISSHYFETDTSHDFYSEQLISLSSLSTYYYNLDYLECKPESIEEIRELLGLDPTYHYYGIFQNMSKFHPRMIQFISDVCKSDSLAFFLLTVGDIGIMQEHLKKCLPPMVYDRIRLYSYLPKYDYCRVIQAVDVHIDTYPFGGCNTSLDAFYFRKVVVTLPSQKLNGRFTYGFYKHMNILEPICNTYEEWVEKSIYYASHQEARMKLEAQIGIKSPLLFRDEKSRVDWIECINTLFAASI
jgi:predicted O-linked N-acetylglucosamine transferase (SPINDLY family)